LSAGPAAKRAHQLLIPGALLPQLVGHSPRSAARWALVILGVQVERSYGLDIVFGQDFAERQLGDLCRVEPSMSVTRAAALRRLVSKWLEA
jgi:hypothetical protein